jgi:hypothetical protein
MSATIFYRPVRPRDSHNLEVLLPSSFIDAMETAFGSQPWRLDGEDIPILRGMAAFCHGSPDNPFERLIKAIEKLDAIEVWPEA